MVTPNKAGAGAQICVVGVLDPLPFGRSPPQPTGAGGKTGLIKVDDGSLGLLSLVVTFDEVFTPSVTFRLESLGVQQRFFYD
jgi:hypothetical protein